MKESIMEFYVIYSFDITKDLSVVPFKPPFIKRWDLTEQDDQYEYDYLGYEYENGKHRKYCAMLDKKHFNQFVNDCNLYMTDIQTMGSITEYGHLPAHSFDYNYDGYDEPINANAYVTPIINNEMNEKNWNRIKKAMLSMYEGK